MLALRAAPVRADSADDQYAVAAGHYARGNWALAVEEFEAFLDEYPGHAQASRATFYLAESLVQTGRYADAHDRFRDFLSREPDSPHAKHARFRAAEAIYLAGNRERAQRELEEFRTRYADDDLDAYVLTYLGDIALARRDAATAADWYQSSLDRFPRGPLADDCRYGLARTWQENGELDRAAEQFRALAANRASHLADDALFQLGACQYSAGDYTAAAETLAAFEGPLAASELHAQARLAQGWALFQLQRYDESAELLATLEDDPRWNVEAGYWLALIDKAQERWRAAAERLSATARRAAEHPLAAEINYHAGDALARAGDADAALAAFDACEAADRSGDWRDECLLGRLQVALDEHQHADVDNLADEFEERFADSNHRADVTRIVARSLIDRGEHLRAIERLEPLVAVDDPSAADRYLLAVAYQSGDRHDDALRVLVDWQADDDPQLAAEAALVRGTSLSALKKFDEAIPSFEQYLAHGSNDTTGASAARCRAELAVCCARAGRMDDARRWFGELESRHADDGLLVEATHHLAEAAYAADEFDWSAELFERLGQLKPAANDPQPGGANDVGISAAQSIAGLAWSRYRQGNLDAALAAFSQVLDKHASEEPAAEAALMVARIEAERGHTTEALAAYQKVIDQYADSTQVADALRAAARLYEQAGDYRAADGCYRRLVSDFPEAVDADAALYEWAWTRNELGETAEADELFERLRTEHPDSRFVADATYRLAERAQQAGDLDQAAALLAELTESDSVDPSILEHALYLSGQVAVARKAWADVEAPLARLIAECPDSSLRPLAEYWRAEARYRLGQSDAALAAFDALAVAAADSDESWAPLVALRRAQIKAERREWLEALEIAEQIAARHPGFGQQHEVDYVIGRCLASQARFDDARAAYARVVNSSTAGKTETAAMAQWMIGETYFHRKDYRAAIKEYLRVEILYAYPEWQAAALLQAGKCHERLDEWNEAVRLYTRLVENFGDTSYAEEAATRANSARQRLSARNVQAAARNSQ